MKRKLISLAAVAACLALATGPLLADSIFNGTLYYTNYQGGGDNVNKVTYSYDQTSHTLTMGTPTGIAQTPGADGIVFDPQGNLLIGGQGTGKVYQVNPSNGSFTGVVPGTTGQDQNSYHLTVNPSGSAFYTSDFGGPLDTVPLPFGTQGSTTAITGGDHGVTQLAFAPNGTVFYDTSAPNCCGDVGTINLTTGITTKLFSAVTPAHGIIYDPFTGLITMFGDGQVGTMTQTGTGLLTATINGDDFDQGAVDGFGHAFIAGSNEITFVDYSNSGAITNPNFVTAVSGFNNIDDLAPLVGAGSQTGVTPEPSSVLLLVTGLFGLAWVARRRRVEQRS